MFVFAVLKHDKASDLPVRKGSEEADFVYLRESTGATAGNLSVQIDKLSTAGYIKVEKTFEGRKPRTICTITPAGLTAFEDYFESLKSYLTH